jgi:hypothetical protein
MLQRLWVLIAQLPSDKLLTERACPPRAMAPRLRPGIFLARSSCVAGNIVTDLADRKQTSIQRCRDGVRYGGSMQWPPKSAP